MTAPAAAGADAEARRFGFACAFSAYLLWGFLPFYLQLLGFASPWEILAQRILWCVPAAGLAVLAMGGVRDTMRALRTPGVLPALALSAALISVNWGLFVWAVTNDRVIEASFAYYITPLVSVAVGVFGFGERLKGLQGWALGVGAAGVAVQGLALGGAPWIPLVLAGSWSAYAVVRKQAPVPAAGGLMAETALLAPFAGLALLWLGQTEAGLGFGQSINQSLLLAVSGAVTAVPLILFTLGARRVSFTTLGLLQYIAPSIQLAIGLSKGEPFTPLRAVSFLMIWAGLALFTVEGVRAKADA